MSIMLLFIFYVFVHCFFFFFSSRRRHTRLVSDWSSDVCSSDLCDLPGHVQPISHVFCFVLIRGALREHTGFRSEERRVGKECRSRWEPDHYKKKERRNRRETERYDADS